jgi:hypothetical protein
MSWRGVWFRSRLTGLITTAFIWLVLAALAPVFVGAYLVLGALAVAGWRSSCLLRWRFGAVPLAPVEAEAALRALIPIDWLRGRHQPRLWKSARFDGVVASNRQQLVIGSADVAGLVNGRGDSEFCRAVPRALGIAVVHRSRLVAAVDLFCVPWIVASQLVQALATASRRQVRFGRAVWRARWLFLAIAAADLAGRSMWVPLMLLAFAAVATVTTPRWNRAWAARVAAMSERGRNSHPGWHLPSPRSDDDAIAMPLGEHRVPTVKVSRGSS